MSHQTIIVVDFGGQYNQLIARRVRECNVYCEVIPYTKALQAIKEQKPQGIIFTGGPASVYEAGAPSIEKEVFELGIPVLGICYGAQLMAQALGGVVTPATLREYGKTEVDFDTGSLLFKELSERSTVWMSHGVMISKVPEGFTIAAHTPTCPVAAMQDEARKFFGFQFHPEVTHTQNGTEMIRRFLYNVCGCSSDWTMGDYVKTAVENIQNTVGEGKVLLALSGGVDSSVAVALLSRAVGERLTCIFVDHGLMRKNEGDEVEEAFAGSKLNCVRVNAEKRLLEKLKGVADPETKRKIIGEEFIRVFEEEAKKIGRVDFLAQGTIYPDVIE
ncbi:MAG: glutamine-hydrolyzing GMP synthase, partial [Oscillospiraceae bacterium]